MYQPTGIKFSFYWLVLAACASMLTSCKKDTIAMLTREASSNTTQDLYDVVLVNDSTGYACGGDRWTIGVALRTTDGGQTWKCDSISPNCLYKCKFFNATMGIIVGNGGFIGFTPDSGETYNVTNSGTGPILDIAYPTITNGIIAGGVGYTEGYIAHTNDGVYNWQKTDVLNSINAISYTDSNTIFASGYGVVYRSTNGGVSFSPLGVRGDFFVSNDFPSANAGYFAGYEGSILKTTDLGNSFKTILKSNNAFSKRRYFRKIKFWDDNNGYVVGDAGVMYNTTDGGETWNEVENFTDANLRSIALFSATSGIVVGDNGKIFLFQK